jgi:phosphonate degradation associated HDIG domain protein
MDTIALIEDLFRRHGDRHYDGARAEAVTAREHALQCAQLAEWADAPPTLVAAALLHDVGHFIDADVPGDGVDDRHEWRAMPLLRAAFGAAVAEPVRLHVDAKRYLTAVEPDYLGGLSAASVHSLMLQGGPMDAAERAAFEAEPAFREALALRRWDEQAKVAGRATPTLDYYLALLEELRPAR